MTTVNPAVYSSFGQLLTRRDVETGMLSHLEKWLITYLAEVERQQELDPHTLPAPGSWEVVNEFQRYPEDMLPTIAVISPGLSGGRPPRREGDGMITAYWLIAVGAVVMATEIRSSKDLAGYYGAALRGCVMQLPELGGFANGVDWNDERYDDFPRVTERDMAAVRLVFTVEVQNVMNVFGTPTTSVGVPTPPDDPYATPLGYPTVNEYDITVENDQGGP